MIINGFIECGTGTETEGALDRADYYSHLLSYFNLPAETGTGCANMGNFSAESSSAYNQNFTASTTYGTCEITKWQSEFSMFRNDDYKRCVCKAWAPTDDSCLNGSLGEPFKFMN